MSIIYTKKGLFEVPFSYNLLLQAVDVPQVSMTVRLLPFGSHNPEWIKNEKLWSHHFKEFDPELYETTGAPPTNCPLPHKLEEIIRNCLGDRFQSCTGVPGPTPNPKRVVDTWISGQMYRLMKFGDEPAYCEVQS
jgi:hypothetical protein